MLVQQWNHWMCKLPLFFFFISFWSKSTTLWCFNVFQKYSCKNAFICVGHNPPNLFTGGPIFFFLTALFLKLSVLMVTHHFALYLEKSKWGTWTCSIILQSGSVMPFCKYKKISCFAIAQLYGLIICGLCLLICVFICPFIDVLYVHMYRELELQMRTTSQQTLLTWGAAFSFVCLCICYW